MRTRISVMLAVDNAAEAAAWYRHALGATELWSLGSVVALARRRLVAAREPPVMAATGKLKPRVLMPAQLARSLVLAGAALVMACGRPAPDVSQGPTCAANAGQARLDFTLKDLDGRDVPLSDFKGRVLFLNFWATWCGPCRVEIPALVDLQRRYGPAGLAVVGVVVHDDFALAGPYAASAGINYPVLDGTDRDDLDRAYRPPVLPSSFLIARDGSLCSMHRGIPRPGPGERIEDGIRRTLEAVITPLL